MSPALYPAPPLGPELSELLAAASARARATPAAAPAPLPVAQRVAQLIGGRPITSDEHTVPERHGAPALPITVFRRADHTGGRPAILYFHGGAMVRGDRFTALGPVLDWVEDLGVVLVTVEYRLAPQPSTTALVEDCYSSLLWLSEHADEVGADPDWIIVAGSSSGGGLAAGVALMARDLSGPPVAGQALIYPMLDDRGDTTSTRQLDDLNGQATSAPAGTPCSDRSAAATLSLPTQLLPARRTCPDCRRPTSRWARQRPSATKPSPTRHACGPAAARRSFTCGREPSTPSTSSPPPRSCPRRHARPASAGSRGTSATTGRRPPDMHAAVSTHGRDASESTTRRQGGAGQL